MRITKVETKRLFGIFDHEVPFNLKPPVTIMHGPNGVGKTVVLKMLFSLFSNRLSFLRDVPCDELAINFEGDERLVIRKSPLKNGRSPKPKSKGELHIEHLRGKEVLHAENIPEQLATSMQGYPLDVIERIIPELDRVAPRTWVVQYSGEPLELDEVIERYGHRFPELIESHRVVKVPEWLRTIQQSIPVNFIATDRLLKNAISSRTPDYRPERKQHRFVNAVDHYSDEIKQAIQTRLADYASLSQSLDRSFPSRLMKSRRKKGLSTHELRVRLASLEAKRAILISTGLIDKEKEIDISSLPVKDDISAVLHVYVEDVEEKLAFFDELQNKINLLVTNINGRFLHKSFSIKKNEGFVFTTDKGRQLKPTDLSSGEQHELVLLYELLFKVKRDALILIDEPELSLHIAWQQEFVPNLAEIAELGGFQVLLATHAPAVINDRWDLAVQLGDE